MESSNKPRILIFIDWFVPGYKAGGPIQSCANLIAHLKNDFDFWVITRDTDYCSDDPYPNVVSDSWNKLDAHLQVFYTSADNLTYSSLLKATKEAHPDVIFINGIYSLYFSVIPLKISQALKFDKVIVSARGMLAPSAIAVKGLKKKAFLYFAQLLGLYKHVAFHATNQVEKEHIIKVFGTKQQVYIAPNLAKPAQDDALVSISKNKHELRLVSIARISPEKNTKYALEVLNNFEYAGNIHFDLYGPVYDEAYWNDCLQQIAYLNANIKVNYKGSLESNLVQQTLQQYHALFLPTRGENFGHIILESLAAGLPVLISDQTPWRNLSQKNIGYDLSLTEPALFSETIQTLLDLNQEQYSVLSEYAFTFAKAYKGDKEAIHQNITLLQQNL